VLGLVQRGIGRPDQRVDAVAVLRMHRHADRDSDRRQRRAVKIEPVRLDGCANLLRADQCSERRHLDQRNDELLPAVAAGDVAGAHDPPQLRAHGGKHAVAGLVAVLVI